MEAWCSSLLTTILIPSALILSHPKNYLKIGVMKFWTHLNLIESPPLNSEVREKHGKNIGQGVFCKGCWITMLLGMSRTMDCWKFNAGFVSSHVSWLQDIRPTLTVSRVCLQESPRLPTKKLLVKHQFKIQGMCIQFQIEPHKIMHLPYHPFGCCLIHRIVPWQDGRRSELDPRTTELGRLTIQLSETLKYAKAREWRRILNLRSCRKCVFLDHP